MDSLISLSCSTDADLGNTRWVSAYKVLPDDTILVRPSTDDIVQNKHISSIYLLITSSNPISKRHSTAPLIGKSLVEKVGLPMRMDLYFSSFGFLSGGDMEIEAWLFITPV